MIDHGKKNVIGVLVDAVDQDAALRRIGAAARGQQPLTVSALAVHGVMSGYIDTEHRIRLNHLDLVVPDGQPVRWALNLLYRTRLPHRVYGPTLMLETCRLAEKEAWGIYLYGSTAPVLEQLEQRLRQQFPHLQICGVEPSKFRRLSASEREEVAARIRNSGAAVTFVGLGCPRQEIWAYEHRDVLEMPVVAVGAAFAFLAGTRNQAPKWMQDRGLEWLFRLMTEPRRLWRRYVLLNPWYASLVLAQWLRLRHFPTIIHGPVRDISYG